MANALADAQNAYQEWLRTSRQGDVFTGWGTPLVRGEGMSASYGGQTIGESANLGQLASQNQGLMDVLKRDFGYGGPGDLSAQTYGYQGIQANAQNAANIAAVERPGGYNNASWNQPAAAPAPAGGSGGQWSGTGGATGVGGSGNMSGNAGTSNPYLGEQVNWLRQNAQENYDRVTAPQIRYGMSSGGGYGGSRMGVLEANAQRDMNNSVNGAIAGMLGNNWQQDQSRITSDRTANRGLDLQQNQQGWNQYMQGVQGQAGMNAGAYGVGTQQQQAPWLALNNAAQTYQPFSGLGQTTTNTQNRDRSQDWQTYLGAGLGIANAGSNFGWW